MTLIDREVLHVAIETLNLDAYRRSEELVGEYGEPWSMATNGNAQVVEFFDLNVWCSEDDEVEDDPHPIDDAELDYVVAGLQSRARKVVQRLTAMLPPSPTF